MAAWRRPHVSPAVQLWLAAAPLCERRGLVCHSLPCPQAMTRHIARRRVGPRGAWGASEAPLRSSVRADCLGTRPSLRRRPWWRCMARRRAWPSRAGRFDPFRGEHCATLQRRQRPGGHGAGHHASVASARWAVCARAPRQATARMRGSMRLRSDPRASHRSPRAARRRPLQPLIHRVRGAARGRRGAATRRPRCV